MIESCLPRLATLIMVQGLQSQQADYEESLYLALPCLANHLSQTLFSASPKCMLWATGRAPRVAKILPHCIHSSQDTGWPGPDSTLKSLVTGARAWVHVWEKIAQHFQAPLGSSASGMNTKPCRLGSTRHRAVRII